MNAVAARRLLLVQPPFYRLYRSSYSLDRFPLSLAYLAGAVRHDGRWRVRAYNADFTPDSEPMTVRYRTGEGFRRYLANLGDPTAPIWQEVRTALAEERPTVVGITAKSQEFAAATMVARLAKELDPRTVVVIGGPHPSLVGADVLRCPDVDVYVRGEGEQTLVELLAALADDRALTTVPGIGYRGPAGPVETPARAYLPDLDALDFPHAAAAEVLIGYDRYPPEAFRYVFATRGCQRNCLFCGSHRIWSRRVRFRSPANVVDELRALQARGLRSVHFDDDTFGVTRAHLRRLCEAIRAGCPGLTWSCELHVALADDESIRRMRQAGCTSIQLGIESGNDAMLERVRKHITIRQALEACRVIRRHGIELHAFFMVGFPWETEASLRDTITAIGRTHCSTVSYSIFTPYQGTDAFAECRRLGLVGDDFDASLYNHQSPANHFCAGLSHDRFRELVAQVERAVDRRNARVRLRHAFSLHSLRRVRERGLVWGVRRALRRLGSRPAGA
jgi:anaerobic magnesium-protoporphyrin IX monomethyl ester cyclase